MTDIDPSSRLGSGGDVRAPDRRRIVYTIIVLSLLLGSAVGVGMVMFKGGALKFTPVTAWSLAALAALLIAGLSAWFYRWVDEVEVKDNLWANTVGLHVGFAIGAPWVFLADMGHAPEVSASILLLIIVGSGALYYTAVKLWRMM
jgi:hypothetical protein